MNDMWSTLILHSLKSYFNSENLHLNIQKKESKDITERVKGNDIKLSIRLSI